jgi:membrane-bound lytic murein transglycosylase F
MESIDLTKLLPVRSNGITRFFYFSLFIALTSCHSKKNQSAESNDFSQILQTGEINVLTLSGSMSYYMYKGEPKGYEYEVLSDFADSLHLKVNIRLAENETKLTEMLLRGEGDLIAYNIPVTNEGKEELLYCGRKEINEQVLVQRANKRDTLLKDVTELIGKDVWVIHDSKYYRRLKNLNDELGGGIHIRIIEKDTVTVEDLIEMVSKGEIPYTLSDNDMAKLNKTYFNNIDIALKVGHLQRSSWAVRKTSLGLAAAINDWFEKNQNASQYKRIAKRYFEMSKMPGGGPAPVVGRNQISPFDHLFKDYALKIGWDWRLLASISYQESRFYTDRVSWAGAAGLMGLMPKTAESFGVSLEDIYDPEQNIRAAAGYIKNLNRSFSSIEDEDERIKFILASYNAGPGHIFDARALSEKYGKDPERWDDVEEYLKLKKLPEYYNDPVCKSGYFRGTETLNYVKDVFERWHHYQEKVAN